MASIYDVDQGELVEQAAKELKKVEDIKLPKSMFFAKTGMHKQRPPVDKEWWYARAASILRLTYKLGPIGVSKLRVKYGGKKNRGVRPGKFYKGSGNILRKILQQLEKAGLVKQEKDGQHRGRITTQKGKSFLDKIAAQLSKRAKIEKKEEKKEKSQEQVKKTKEKSEKAEKEKIPAEQSTKETNDSVKTKKEEKVPTAHELAKNK
ncbi:30S ribosomal protein S19e [Candidatus Woesearchaeota archaeon]|nr:30S ribosomal protein S19e [Candidatus Woesearchaeota archaeon]